MSDPAVMTKAAPGQVIHLPDGFVHVTPPVGLADNRFKYELVPGRYVAEVEDVDGTYFQGPDGCVRTSIAESSSKEFIGQVTTSNGGIFIPVDASAPARMWFIQGSQRTGLPGDVATTIALNAAPMASPVMAGAGAGLGAGIVTAMMAMGQGHIAFTLHPVQGLRNVVTVTKE